MRRNISYKKADVNQAVCREIEFHRHVLNELDSDSSARKVQPCHPELPFTSHKRGIDETWRSAFQTEAKDLAAGSDRPFASLRACPRAKRRGDTVRLFKQSRTFRPN